MMCRNDLVLWIDDPNEARADGKPPFCFSLTSAFVSPGETTSTAKSGAKEKNFAPTVSLQLFVADESAVGRTHVVIVDLKPGFSSENDSEIVLVDVVTKRHTQPHRPVAVFTSGRRYLSEFSVYQFVAEAIVRHSLKFIGSHVTFDYCVHDHASLRYRSLTF